MGKPSDPPATPPEKDDFIILAEHPHDFEVQKRVHRQIRNDPDYDDWEYGTEPLPHESWLKEQVREKDDND
jgi:hypothetical protein